MQSIDCMHILHSYSVNYPILKEMGFYIRKPIALVGAGNVLQDFTSKLSIVPVVEDVATSPIMIQEKMELLNSEAFVMDCCINYGKKHGKVERNLSMLFQAARSGIVDQIELCAATFALFEKKIPQELQEKFFIIHIREDCNENISDLTWSIPDEGDIPQILEALIMHRNEWSPLRAAVQFLYPAFKRHNKLDYFTHLCDVAYAIDDSAESFDEGPELLNLFVDELKSYLSNVPVNIYSLLHLPPLELDAFMDSIFYREENIYISEVLFKKIVEPLLGVYHVNLIKELLAAVGILELSGTGYTSKVCFKLDGTTKRMRMMKFNFKELPELKSFLFI